MCVCVGGGGLHLHNCSVLFCFWILWVNTHAGIGGYQYRLCPADEKLTEECFQRMPLDFVKAEHKLLWNNGSVIAVLGEDKGVFVEGEGVVLPQGSMWARNVSHSPVSKGAKNRDLRLFCIPACLAGARCKTRLESGIKGLNPHFVYDIVLQTLSACSDLVECYHSNC